MKMEEIRSKTPEALAGDLEDLYSELFNLRFQLATGQLSKTSAIKDVKGDIARIRTVQRERELSEARSEV
jgi:large subunit ribosomal protein L29